MEERLRKLIDSEVFRTLVLEVKKGVYTDKLYEIGELIWDEAQRDILEKLAAFEKDEKVLIITESDREMLHGFDYTSEEHMVVRERFREFLKKGLSEVEE